MIRERVDNPLVAVIGPFELQPIFVQNSEIQQGADMSRKASQRAFVILDSRFIVAAAIVFQSQPKERSRMFRINFDGSFIESDDFERISANRGDPARRD